MSRKSTLASVAVVLVIGIGAACKSSSTGGGSCDTLAACCDKAPAEDQASCQEVVKVGYAATCTEELTVYQLYCGATQGGSGTGTGAGAGGCAALASCCAEMKGTSNAATCNAVVNDGVASACTGELEVFMSGKACSGGGMGTGTGMGGTGIGTGTGHGTGQGTGTGTGVGNTNACVNLAMCCAQMSGTQQQACDVVVNAGNESTCEAELQADQSGDLCLNIGTGTGQGTGPGTGTGTGQGTFDGGTDGGLPPQCTVPSVSASGGSCVVVVPDTGDAGVGITCNPVTNVPCASGSACDVGTDSVGNPNFQCWAPPPTNTTALCQACDDMTTACIPGATCMTGTGTCAKYCCTNADCGAGKCTTVSGGMALFAAAPNLGICTR